MTDLPQPADATSSEAIQARADARLRKRIKYLEGELQGKCALIAKLSEDMAAAQRQAAGEIAHLNSVVADANTRIKTLERERDDARADTDYHQRNFNQVLNALQSIQTGEFAHIAAALQRARMQ